MEEREKEEEGIPLVANPCTTKRSNYCVPVYVTIALVSHITPPLYEHLPGLVIHQDTIGWARGPVQATGVLYIVHSINTRTPLDGLEGQYRQLVSYI